MRVLMEKFVPLQIKKRYMACILHIETSTDVCSVAVSEDGQCIFEQQKRGERGAGAEHLGTMIDEAMSFTDNHAIPFDAVAVSCGPGSYTGLRIGVSMAKGICYGRDLKLLAVPTWNCCASPCCSEIRKWKRTHYSVPCSMLAGWRSMQLFTTAV